MPIHTKKDVPNGWWEKDSIQNSKSAETRDPQESRGKPMHRAIRVYAIADEKRSGGWTKNARICLPAPLSQWRKEPATLVQCGTAVVSKCTALQLLVVTQKKSQNSGQRAPKVRGATTQSFIHIHFTHSFIILTTMQIKYTQLDQDQFTQRTLGPKSGYRIETESILLEPLLVKR